MVLLFPDFTGQGGGAEKITQVLSRRRVLGGWNPKNERARSHREGCAFPAGSVAGDGPW